MNLQFESKILADCLRQFEITIPAQEVQRRWQQSLRQVQETANVKGFRRGFVPIELVMRLHGKDLKHQLYHDLVQGAVMQVLHQEKLEILGEAAVQSTVADPCNREEEAGVQQAALEAASDASLLKGEASQKLVAPATSPSHQHPRAEFSENKDLSFTAQVSHFPLVKIEEYRGLVLEGPAKTEISEEQVEAFIQMVNEATAEPKAIAEVDVASRGLQKDDFAALEGVARLVAAGGDLVACPELTRHQEVEIGQDSFCPELPGWDEQLIGLKTQETKTFRLFLPVELPSASRLAALAGKQIEFHVAVLEIKEKKLAVVDEAFATTRGYDSLAEYKTTIKEGLARQLAKGTHEDFKRQAVEKVLEPYSFLPPMPLVQQWLVFLTRSFVQERGLEGQSQEVIKEALSKVSEQITAQAVFCVKRDLILSRIARLEGIKIHQAVWVERFVGFAEHMKLKTEELAQFFKHNPDKLRFFEQEMLNDLVLEFLLKEAFVQSKEEQSKEEQSKEEAPQL